MRARANAAREAARARTCSFSPSRFPTLGYTVRYRREKENAVAWSYRTEAATLNAKGT
jgi:hypothetical protein